MNCKLLLNALQFCQRSFANKISEKRKVYIANVYRIFRSLYLYCPWDEYYSIDLKKDL